MNDKQRKKKKEKKRNKWENGKIIANFRKHNKFCVAFDSWGNKVALPIEWYALHFIK